MKLDKETLDAIIAATIKVQEMYEERYVTGTELCKQISMFSKDWLDKYGWKLPRERIEVTDDSGEKRATRWGYPLHAIQRMVSEGRLRNL